MNAPLFYRVLHDRARFFVQGPDAKRFLHGMLTQNIVALLPGQGCASVLLDAQGRFLGDLTVYIGIGNETDVLLQMEGRAGAAVQATLEQHIIMDDVTLTPIQNIRGQLAIQGEGAAALLCRLVPELPESIATLPLHHHVRVYLQHDKERPLRVVATHELGVPGYFVVGPYAVVNELESKLQAHQVVLLSQEEETILRVEAGQPKYGVDMDEDRLPLEIGLSSLIDFHKGCYLGQEVIVRTVSRGFVTRRLVGLRFLNGGAPPPLGQNLAHPSKPNAGVVLSGCVSPRFGSIALACVHQVAWELGTSLYVAARGAELTDALPQALVTALPFGRTP